MKEILEKYKILITTLVFLMLLLAVMFFIAGPFVNKIKEKADNIQKKKLDNQMDRERIVKIPQMEETQKIIQENSSMINVILNHDDEVEFIKELEKIAEETENKMTLSVDEKTSNSKPKIENDKEDKKKGILNSLSYNNYISIKVIIEGNYLGFMNFMNKLENFKYYVNIISLDLKKSVEAKGNTDTSRDGSIFSAPSSETLQKNTSEENISRKEKDTLLSTINIIVYTK